MQTGSPVIVQVVKDPLGTKGARLTTNISIPSRYMVFMPNVSNVGVSQKIEDEAERGRLREILTNFAQSNSLQAGFIARTAAEGASAEALRADMEARLGALEAGLAEVEGSAGGAVEAYHRRLVDRVGELTRGAVEIDPSRIAQEAALLAGKADVREELDRLKAHVATARDIMTVGGPAGRRLDFLCQEMNREANTICSKSSDLTLTGAGLGMKAAVEQFREQVQNVE